MLLEWHPPPWRQGAEDQGADGPPRMRTALAFCENRLGGFWRHSGEPFQQVILLFDRRRKLLVGRERGSVSRFAERMRIFESWPSRRAG